MCGRYTPDMVLPVEKPKSVISLVNVLCASSRYMSCYEVVGRDLVLAVLASLVHFEQNWPEWHRIGPLLAIMVSDLTP